MADEPGAAQDLRSQIQWLEQVRRQHHLERFAPPCAMCSCKNWSISAPPDFGVLVQRDYLLDAFNGHLKFMRAERRKYLAARKLSRKAA